MARRHHCLKMGLELRAGLTTALTTSLVLLGACGGDGRQTDASGGTGDGGIDPFGTDSGTTSTTGQMSDSLDDGSAVSSTGSPDVPTCGESNFELQAIPPNVVLVLDKSGSMVTNSWDADGDESTPDVTRWRTLFDVAELVLNEFNSAINFGAALFPRIGAGGSTNDSTTCEVASAPTVAVAPSNASTILDAIPDGDADEDEIRGATPATAGVQTALDHLLSLDASVPRFMILVTDGAANCSATATEAQCPADENYDNCEKYEVYDENLPLVVADARDQGIPTFVVGIDIIPAEVDQLGAPDINTYEALNEVAEAGGRPRDGAEKFFNALNQAELQAALTEIAGQVVTCTIPLDPEPEYPQFVSVSIAGEQVPRVEDCSSEDGWMFTNADGPYDSIELCGTACDALADAGTLDATYGCQPPG